MEEFWKVKVSFIGNFIVFEFGLKCKFLFEVLLGFLFLVIICFILFMFVFIVIFVLVVFGKLVFVVIVKRKWKSWWGFEEDKVEFLFVELV